MHNKNGLKLAGLILALGLMQTNVGFAADSATTAVTAAASTPADENPPQHHGGHHHRPPPEAIAACKDKAADAACSFTRKDGSTEKGTCGAPPNTSLPLACHHPHGPDDQGPPGGPPPAE